MKEQIIKMLRVLPVIKHYDNAVVTLDDAYTRDVIVEVNTDETSVFATYPKGATIAVLQAKEDNTLVCKHLLFCKLPVDLIVSRNKGYLALEKTNAKVYDTTCLVYEKLKSSLTINHYDNDQQIAAFLREMEIDASHVLICPYESV